MANTNSIEKRVLKLLEPIVENKFELVDVEFVKEGPNRYLRVYIDKDGGITIDDCEVVSRALEKALDEQDSIEQTYILEVSSPGIDRPIKRESDFEKYKGQMVDIRLYKLFEGTKEYQGKLIGLVDDVVSISVEDRIISFTRKELASIRLAVIF